jgi:hypothetical protein
LQIICKIFAKWTVHYELRSCSGFVLVELGKWLKLAKKRRREGVSENFDGVKFSWLQK